MLKSELIFDFCEDDEHLYQTISRIKFEDIIVGYSVLKPYNENKFIITNVDKFKTMVNYLEKTYFIEKKYSNEEKTNLFECNIDKSLFSILDSFKAKKAVYENEHQGISEWCDDMYGSGYFIRNDCLYKRFTNNSETFMCTKSDFVKAGGKI